MLRTRRVMLRGRILGWHLEEMFERSRDGMEQYLSSTGVSLSNEGQLMPEPLIDVIFVIAELKPNGIDSA